MPPDYYNFEDFGGVAGNPTAANHTALQLAVSTMNAYGGGVLYCDGHCYFTNFATLPNLAKVKILGSPRTVFESTQNKIINFTNAIDTLEIRGIKFVSTKASTTEILRVCYFSQIMVPI